MLENEWADDVDAVRARDPSHALSLERPYRGILHVRGCDSFHLAEAFLRPQEHYESPEFRGRVFTREAFAAWYAERHGGVFTYADDWAGYNLPDTAFTPFLDGRFDPLSPHERFLLDAVADLPRPYYVIGTIAGDPHEPHAVRHELSHAMWYFHPTYRDTARILLAGVRPAHLQRMRKHLNGLGYHPAVIDDELVAYLTDPTAPHWLARLNGLAAAPVIRPLRTLLERHLLRHTAVSRKSDRS